MRAMIVSSNCIQGAGRRQRPRCLFAVRHPDPQSRTEEILIDHDRELGGDVE
jgi:hypothetical protein